jgi:hypothetical protein
MLAGTFTVMILAMASLCRGAEDTPALRGTPTMV